MPTLTPTGGHTYCTVETGSFPKTYDGHTTTHCCFKRDQTCLSEWYWDTPVKVTKFNILAYQYFPDSRINAIWGRVSGSWVQIWGWDEWKPSHNAWDSKAVSCDNCTGIRISQTHEPQPARPCIVEVNIDYEEVVVEGKATIISIDKPSSFTPGVPFNIKPKIRNDGGDDKLWLRLVNKDTNYEIIHRYITLASGQEYMPTWTVTITQETDFHGKIEAGHVE